MSPGSQRDPWDVPGQDRAAAVLRSAVARGEVGHAWALTGPRGVGQEQAARALAAALNCGDVVDGVPCGTCSVCARVLRGAFPAYWEFLPTGMMHRVADVRERWVHAAMRSSVEGRWKVLRVVDAERMNEAAANAFLKLLEEPPERTTWVLDVADPDELPDTILSRCRELRFVPLRADILRQQALVLGLSEDDSASAVRAALGSPAALRRLAAPGGLDDLRAHRAIPGRLRREGPAFALVAARMIDDEVKRRTAQLKAAGKAELEALEELYGDQPPRGLVKQVGDRLAREERETRTATVQAALDDLVGWYRDCLLLATGGDPADALHAGAAPALREDADALGAARALAAVDLVLAARESLELNVQQGLALESLFLELSVLALPHPIAALSTRA